MPSADVSELIDSRQQKSKMSISEYRQKATAGITSRVQSITDRVVSPDTRQQFYTNLSTFANEQPLLAAFLAIQLLLSFTPLALFTSFVVATVLFSFIAAVLFSLFWIGAALMVLIPTLFVSVSLGIAIWAWAVGSFIVSRWLYNMIPISVRGGMALDMPNGKTVVVNKTGEGYGDVDAKVETH